MPITAVPLSIVLCSNNTWMSSITVQIMPFSSRQAGKDKPIRAGPKSLYFKVIIPVCRLSQYKACHSPPAKLGKTSRSGPVLYPLSSVVIKPICRLSQIIQPSRAKQSDQGCPLSLSSVVKIPLCRLSKYKSCQSRPAKLGKTGPIRTGPLSLSSVVKITVCRLSQYKSCQSRPAKPGKTGPIRAGTLAFVLCGNYTCMSSITGLQHSILIQPTWARQAGRGWSSILVLCAW